MLWRCFSSFHHRSQDRTISQSSVASWRDDQGHAAMLEYASLQQASVHQPGNLSANRRG
jgi:hypothetical protein